MLRAADFARREIAEAHLGVLRDMRPESDEIVAAIKKLIELDPASASSTPTGTTAEAAVRARVMRILVVEDDLDASDALVAELVEAGHDVQSCMNAPVARWLLPRFRPDVVLVDIGLPVVDGNALAAYIREASARPPLLIAVTGVPPAVRPDLFDAVVAKPVGWSRLEEILGRRRPTAPSP